jgi:hypothetical protein
VAPALSALAPAALELSVAAATQIEAHRGEVDRIWRQRLERAAIACDRAQRCYQLAEPENRLVVRQLERDWEDALAAHARLADDYERHQRARPARLSPTELAAIRALAADIPAIWHAPTPPTPTARRCCAPSSTPSRSPPPVPANGSTSAWSGPAAPTPTPI